MVSEFKFAVAKLIVFGHRVEGFGFQSDPESLESQKLDAVFDGGLFLSQNRAEVVQYAAKFGLFVLNDQGGVVFAQHHDVPEGDGKVVGGYLSGEDSEEHLAHDQKDLILQDGH